ncbi:cation-translocating P-type ATPase [Chloroflexota bacterium]
MNEMGLMPNGNRWYQLEAAEIMKSLSAESTGLTSDEAKVRISRYGYNELKFKKRGALTRFLLQFNSTLIYVLLAAAVITAALDMWIDAAVILAVVLANAVIGFVQEGKAEASMEAVTKMMVPECTVLRDGEQKDIPARELVPGDIVLLEEGDRVPADLRLLYARNLSADEAALTGESVPVEKGTESIPKPNLPPGDQLCIAFSGTFIARGSGRGVVVRTGEQTEIGKIARLMKETPRAVAAPLIRKIAEFTKLLVIVVLSLAVLNLLFGITLGGYDLVNSFLASVSLAVAAIPEGLPAILTIALALGARNMSHRNALIRRLPAVETLGSATVICSDKTGTLTKNEITVVRVYCGKKDYRVTGVGYEPEGEFFLGVEKVNPAWVSDLAETLKAGRLCNNAALEKGDGGYEISGDPTEGALLVAAMKAGIIDQSPRLDEVPFESQHQYMATMHRGEDGNLIYVKGSLEKVLGMCQYPLVDGKTEELQPEEILDKGSEMAKEALRVLGLAYKEVSPDKTSIIPEDLNGLVFLGIQGMLDPPREEAIEAVARCKTAGIRVVMVTGDHLQTAQAIAHQLGIETGGGVLTGEHLSKMSDDELYEAVERVSVFARVAPAHKFRVATQLQRRGHIVAVTGDGVNDAPALKAADLGIAMGIKGTDVAKEASDMVLADDNFATIVTAVEEGRYTFENIRRVILYTLPTNGGQALLIIGALLLLPFIPLFAERFPLEPIQILWINLYDAVILALPLLWEPRESGLLERPPRDPREPIANRLFFRKVGLVSLVMAGAAFIVFYHYGTPAISGAAVDEMRLTQAQTAAFMTVMMVHVFYLLTARSLTKSVFAMNPFSNKRVVIGIALTIALHLLIIYALPHVGINPFRVEPFPVQWWLPIVLLGLSGLLVIEVEEFIVERLNRRSKRI